MDPNCFILLGMRHYDKPTISGNAKGNIAVFIHGVCISPVFSNSAINDSRGVGFPKW